MSEVLTIVLIHQYTSRNMPRSNKAQLTEETLSELSTQFFDFINSITAQQRTDFFKEFLTEEEQLMMFKRLAMYWCLLEGYPLVKIQQLIGVTHDTTRLYNKKKNLLSREFKMLVGNIARKDFTSMPENKSVEETVQEVYETAIDDTYINIETIENQPEQQEVAEIMDPREEENMEPVELIVEDNQQQIHAELPTDESVQQMESITNELNEMRSEATDKDKSIEKSLDEESPKKKRGFGKFFGF